MRIKKIIKYSGKAYKAMYGPQLGELAFKSWELKD